MKFCKEIIILSLLLIFSATTGNTQNCNYSSGWFKVYAHLYNYSEEFEVQMTEPSLLLPQIRYKAMTTNRAQMVLVRNPYITTTDPNKRNNYKYGMNFYIPSRTLFNSRNEVTFSYADFSSINDINQLRINTKTPTDKTLTDKIAAVLVYVDGVLISDNMLEKKEFTVTYYQLLHSEIEVKILFENGTYKCIIPWIDGCEPFEDVQPDFTCSPPCPPPPPNPDDEDPPVVDNPPSLDEQCFLEPDYTEVIESVETFVLNGSDVDWQTSLEDYQKYSTSLNEAVMNGIIPDSSPSTPRNGRVIKSVYLNPIHDKITKPIVICDGIDFLSNRRAKDILEGSLLQILFDGGYDIIIADFEGGADFMQQNAFALIELIKDINQEDGVTIEAIVGPSMGGQVVRYALLYWENYMVDKYGEYDVNLFISADSPWLGANASPALQSLVDALQNNEDFGDDLNPMNALINSPAARQLLIHHQFGNIEDGTIFRGCEAELIGFDWFPVRLFNYFGRSHPYKIRFDREVAEMGHYPKDVPIVAIADGALTDGNWETYLNESNITTPDNPLLVLRKKESGVVARVKLYPSIHNNFPRNIIELIAENAPDCLTRGSLNMYDVKMESSQYHHLDSSPGSPFDMAQYIRGISEIEKVGNFSFIPTFSALGLEDVTDPYENTIGRSSRFFIDSYADFTNSKHTSLYPDDQAGTLPFILRYLGEYSNYNSGSYSVCDYLEDLEQTTINTDPLLESHTTIPCNGADLVGFGCFSKEFLASNAVNTTITQTGGEQDVIVEILEGGILFTVLGVSSVDLEYAIYEVCQTIDLGECVSEEHCQSFTVNINTDDCIADWGLSSENETDKVEDEKEKHFSTSNDFNELSTLTNSIIHDLQIYPNPTDGILNINHAEPGIMELYDVTGKIILRRQLTGFENQLDINANPGMYILHFRTDNGKLYPPAKIFIE